MFVNGLQGALPFMRFKSAFSLNDFFFSFIFCFLSIKCLRPTWGREIIHDYVLYIDMLVSTTLNLWATDTVLLYVHFWWICKCCLVCSLGGGGGGHSHIWLEWVCATEQGMGLRFLSLEDMQFTVTLFSAFNSQVSISNESLEQGVSGGLPSPVQCYFKKKMQQ